MIRRGLVALLLVSLPLTAQEWGERKLEAMASMRRAAPRIAATGDKPVTVDCAKKDSIQQAIDQNPGGTVIEVRGLCVENVRVNHKDVTLRGANPAADGIRSPTITPALTILHSDNAVVENLSFNDNPGAALQLFDSVVTMNNCVISGNNANPAGGAAAIHASSDAFVRATNLTVSNNLRRGMTVQRGAFVFCIACDFANNTGFAAVAVRGGLLSLLRSTVTGRNGIQSIGESSYADIDCINDPSPHPCSMQVTGNAVQAFEGATGALLAAGDFTGAVVASDRATAWVYGARQLAAGQPGHGPTRNIAEFHAIFNATAAIEPNPDLQSRLLGTNASTFARVLVMDNTELAGTIQCESKAAAWVDPTVIAAPGSVIGCD